MGTLQWGALQDGCIAMGGIALGGHYKRGALRGSEQQRGRIAGGCTAVGVHCGGCAAEGGARQRGLPGPLARPRCCGPVPEGPAEPVPGGAPALGPLRGCLCRGGARARQAGCRQGELRGRGWHRAEPLTLRRRPRPRAGPGTEPPQPPAPAWGGPSCPTRASQPPRLSVPPPGVGQRGFTWAPRLQLGISVMSCTDSAGGEAGELQAPAGSFPLPRQPRGGGTGDGCHPWPAGEP